MSKRVANTRGRTTARFGRVRIGYHKRRALSQLEKMEEADRMGNLDETAKQKFEEAKASLQKILPKSMVPSFMRRRTQSR